MLDRPRAGRFLLMAAVCLAGTGFGACTERCRAQGKKDAAADGEKSLAEQLRRIPPREPAEALKTFALEKGFSLELVAAEPDVVDPVDACFDEDGRMYVAEMRGYPFSSEPRPQCPGGIGRENAGVIRLLEDTDGDGRMDRSVVFADEISWPTSVCCYDGGVFVIAPSHVYYFKDTDGDDRADVREIVYSGFSRSNVQGLANNLKWGLDNHIWAAGGRNGAKLTHRGKDLFSLGRRDIRFDPETEKLEPASGGLQFGHSMDDWGNRFVCSNSNHMLHVVFPHRYLRRNPYLGVSGVVRRIAKEGGAAPVFRRSPAEPWRVVRTRRRAADPKYSKRLPKTELVPIGYFTSATGVTIYRGGAYPDAFRGNAFIGDVGGNLVHRKTVRPNGASFVAERADEKTEFIASTDTWFRPVNFVNAPDGTLYILDMYRETIEHPYSIPKDIKAHLDLESGNDRGRIYRLVPPDGKRLEPRKLGSASTAELVAQLAAPNSWNRQTAQRLLWERQDSAAVPALEQRVLEDAHDETSRASSGPDRLYAAASPRTLGRLHALWTLHGLDALRPNVLLHALDDPHGGIREHAVRLSEPRLGSSPDLVEKLGGLVDDDAFGVRMQVAYSLGEAPPEQALPAMIELATAIGPGDRDLRTALLTSATETADELAVALIDDERRRRRTRDSGLLARLLQIVGARPESGDAIRVLAAAASLEDVSEQAGVLVALGEGLARRGSSIRKLLGDDTVDKSLRRRVQSLFESAGLAAEDGEAPLNRRRQAIELLAHADFGTAREHLASMLTPAVPQTLQRDAVQALSRHAEPEVGSVLLARWRTYSPEVRRDVVDAMLGRTGRMVALLDAIASGVVRPGEIGPEKKQLLLNHGNEAIRSRAAELLGSVDSDRAKVVAEYRGALELEADADRGRMVFKKNCAVCHKIGDVGHKVGPEIASASNKSPDDLLITVLDPNREAQPNYVNYTLVTKGGKVVTGMIAAETAASVTLRRSEGKQETVLRSNIERLVSSGKSIMPEGLEKDLTPQQLADVIAFIRALPPPEDARKTSSASN